MSSDKLNIQLVKQKPYKKYKANITFDFHVTQLCKFLRGHKDKKLEIVINGKGVKFDSIAGRKRFASGFEMSFKITEKHTKKLYNDMQSKANTLTAQVKSIQKEAQETKRKLDNVSQDYAAKHAVINLRKTAWKDRVAELEGDREMLKEEIERLRKR